MGLPSTGQRIGDWVVRPEWWADRREHVVATVRRWADEHDIAAGMPLETLRQQVGLPAAELMPKLLDGTGLEVVDGLVRPPGASLPPRVHKAVRTVEEWLAAEPFRAPEADELADLKLGVRELAAAVRAGRLTRIGDGVVLGPDAFDRAVAILATLPQPFTVSQARRALGTTRRVAVPLLEELDRRRITKRADDGTRTVVGLAAKG
jgi:selenocysteine-specific elongation factor